ncbi:MAG: DNA polymerase III subunit gamma/tau [Sandaracinaceae bacterium]
MAYTVLARKYRPQTFADLVGQEHVTRTLSNAIASDRVAHAFLFTGVRGVGKTTTARILAKALCCENGPTPEPCGTCDVCVDITAGRDTDVLEMDGASNNSVEDVRRLQESLPYRPQRDRFKVVIVDEVHMLSTGAFNAFLKTLEEPPDHVKFIFATTEIHKVPVTIRSRCQRYDFRLIPQAVVSRRVREILASESITADDAAVAIVAREAAGSMRDALTLLDQIVAFGGESLQGEEVARVLGIADREVVHRIAAATLDGDGAAVLEHVDQLASNGLDMLHFARQLLELYRDMVVLQVSGLDTELVSMVDEERKRTAEVGASVDLQELQRAFAGFSKVVEDVAQSGTPRTTLEMGLVRLATRPPLRPLAELVARLEEIERRSGGGGGGGGGGRAPRGGGASRGGPPPGGARAAGADAAPTARESARTGPASEAAAQPSAATHGARQASAAQSSAAQTSAAQSGAAQSGAAQPSAAQSGAAQSGAAQSSATGAGASQSSANGAGTKAGGTPAARETATDSAAPARTNDAKPHATRDAQPVESPAARPVATPRQAAPGRSSPPSPAPQTQSPRPAAAPTRGGPSAPADGVDPRLWEKVVSALMDAKPALGALLKHGVPKVLNAERLVMAFPPESFFGRQAETHDARAGVSEVAARVLGGRPEVVITYAVEAVEQGKTLVQVEQERRDARIEATREKALSHPVVKEAAALFAIPTESLRVHVELE